jgi:hypothetical protein
VQRFVRLRLIEFHIENFKVLRNPFGR